MTFVLLSLHVGIYLLNYHHHHHHHHHRHLLYAGYLYLYSSDLPISFKSSMYSRCDIFVFVVSSWHPAFNLIVVVVVVVVVVMILDLLLSYWDCIQSSNEFLISRALWLTLQCLLVDGLKGVQSVSCLPDDDFGGLHQHILYTDEFFLSGISKVIPIPQCSKSIVLYLTTCIH